TEYAVGLGVGDVEPADGCHEPIGEHVQRGSLKMRDEKEQEMLMAKAAEEAAIRVHEKSILCFSDDDEGMSRAHEACACKLFAEAGHGKSVGSRPAPGTRRGGSRNGAVERKRRPRCRSPCG